MKKNRGLTPLALVIVFSGSLLLTACDDKKKQFPQGGIPEVGVVTLKTSPLDITTELSGRISAYRIAEVRPQVSGIILRRNFVEGSDVAAGTSLYQIDPAPYQAAYNSAKGELIKAEAAENIAQITVTRYKKLLGTQSISQQDYDNAVATERQANAAVIAAKAAMENAHINLVYTTVTSPISGHTGKSTVTEGALVTTNQNDPLVTVQQLDPIYVNLTQSSTDFLRLKQELANGTLRQENGKAKVELLLENGQRYPQIGTLEFSDPTVDESTGSITIRAIFSNPKGDLLPGMFVRARLENGIIENALLVPQQGVTRNPRGQATTMVIGIDNKVENRIITTTQAIGDKWLVTKGIQAGDQIIVNGLQRIAPGMQVKVVEVAEDNATTQIDELTK